ncbi:nickel-dependent hydrogenase large subunit [Hoeflea sp. TYP-13]|uniref:nickel-dependent hydrogenase large subunit n=1 Tax=Hoeflea sp. TYP-13 TaxID=3230023 RepID=UPI0034C67513
MSAEGRVVVHIERTGDPRARLDFVPPADISGVLAGRVPREATAIIGAVYRLCGIAQSHASAIAMEEALTLDPPTNTQVTRTVLTMAESLREHLVRIALDWPRLVGRDVNVKPLRPLFDLADRLAANYNGDMDAFAVAADCEMDIPVTLRVIAETEARLSKHIFCEPLTDWLARRSLDELFSWADRAGSGAAGIIASVRTSGGFLIGAKASDLLPADHDSLIDLCNMALGREGDVPETGVYARRANDPLIASLGQVTLGVRLVSRLVELARLPAELRAMLTGAAPAPRGGSVTHGTGSGIVEAARGLLLHRARMEDGRIADYRIMAPTQWNFHPRGIAARCLSRIDGEDMHNVEMQAHMVVQAIDPCVACEVRVH